MSPEEPGSYKIIYSELALPDVFRAVPSYFPPATHPGIMVSVKSSIQFRFCAFDTYYAPPGSSLPPSVSLFTDDGPESAQKITDQGEREIVDWLVEMRQARELLLEELRLPANTYARTGVTDPLIEKDRRTPPGDIDLIFVPDPRRAIAIQVKRLRVIAETTHRDSTPGRQLGNITKLVEQANGSRDIGFCENYALVLVECYGPERADYNFLARGSSPGVFRRIYHLTKDQPLHCDVGLIFVEITQPTRSSHARTGMVAVSVDRSATPLDQSPDITARVRQLVALKRSM